LSIPFESAELLARIRAQLREKAPDDRLRSEVRDAKRKEHEAEAALAAIVTEKESGKKRWWALWALIVLTVLGALIAWRNAQVSNKSNARLALKVEKLHSEVLSERQLLERVQKNARVREPGTYGCSKQTTRGIAFRQFRPPKQDFVFVGNDPFRSGEPLEGD